MFETVPPPNLRLRLPGWNKLGVVSPLSLGLWLPGRNELGVGFL